MNGRYYIPTRNNNGSVDALVM